MKKKSSVKFVKYFHELTESEFKKLCKKKPPMTYADLGVAYPQPKWCGYPGATKGIMGCWSLMSYMVTGKEYCKDCDCLIHAKPEKRGASKS